MTRSREEDDTNPLAKWGFDRKRKELEMCFLFQFFDLCHKLSMLISYAATSINTVGKKLKCGIVSIYLKLQKRIINHLGQSAKRNWWMPLVLYRGQADIICTKSSKLTWPSPSKSASLIIWATSSSVSFSPRLIITFLSYKNRRSISYFEQHAFYSSSCLIYSTWTLTSASEM